MHNESVKILVHWHLNFLSGKIEKIIDVDTHYDTCEKQIYDLIREAILPWRFDGYKFYQIEKLSSAEFRLTLKDDDDVSVAQDFVDDIAEMLMIHRGS